MRTFIGFFALIVGLAAFSSQALAISPYHIEIEVCNRDGGGRLLVAIMDEHNMSVEADGWTRIPPNACRSLFRPTGEHTTHHLYFASPDNGLLALNFGSGRRGGTFCINQGESFSYKDNILNWGRSKNCRGSEKMIRSPYKVLGRYGGRERIFIDNASGGKTGNDGWLCMFGFCL